MIIEEGTLTIQQKLDNVTVSFVTKDFEAVDKALNLKAKNGIQCEFKAIRGKRSLDANGWYYSLLNKFRIALGLSLAEAHNMMLDRYGVAYEDQFVLLPEDVDYLKEEIHYRPIPNKTVEKNGKRWNTYWIIKPSHLYDTQEFSVLLDGLVSECNEIGIPTVTRTELERIKATWDTKNGKA